MKMFQVYGREQSEASGDDKDNDEDVTDDDLTGFSLARILARDKFDVDTERVRLTSTSSNSFKPCFNSLRKLLNAISSFIKCGKDSRLRYLFL